MRALASRRRKATDAAMGAAVIATVLGSPLAALADPVPQEPVELEVGVQDLGIADDGQGASAEETHSDVDQPQGADLAQAAGQAQHGGSYLVLDEQQVQTVRERLAAGTENLDAYVGVADLSISAADTEALNRDLAQIVSEILDGRADLWYIDYGFSYHNEFSDDGSPIVDAISPDYAFTRDDGRTADRAAIESAAQEVQRAAAEAGSWIPASATQQQAADALHDWMVLNVRHEPSATGNAYDALVGRSAGTQGYAQGFELLLRAHGIDAQTVSQMSSDGQARHLWTRACLDGSWYHIDAAWDCDLTSGGVADDTYNTKSDAWWVTDAAANNGWHMTWAPEGQAASDASYDAGVGISDYTGPWVEPPDTVWIQFDANGGFGAMDPVEVPDNEDSALPACAFAWEGKVFAGWNTSPDGRGNAYADAGAVNVSGDRLTLYAQWADAQRYELDLVLNANDGSGESDRSVWGIADEPELPQPQPRDGYEFAGWCTAADGSGALYLPGEHVGSAQATSADVYADEAGVTWNVTNVVLYALWSPLSAPGERAVVSFDANGGSGEMAPIEVAAGEPVAAPDCPFACEGLSFAGWNTEPDGSGTAYAPGDAVEGAQGEVVLYAQWAATGDPAAMVEVSFDANGAIGAMDPLSAPLGEPVQLPGCAFVLAGKVFTGWNSSADGSGRPYAALEEASFGGSTVLYAQWADGPAGEPGLLEISYDANDGSGRTLSQKGAAGEETVVAGRLFERDGMKVASWNTEPDGSGTAYEPGQAAVFDSGETLYAQWAEDAGRPSVSLSFDANGGSGDMAPIGGEPGRDVAVPGCAYVREGYAFSGWNTRRDGSGMTVSPGSPLRLGTSDEVLYAQWRQDESGVVRVAFDANGGSGDMGVQDVAAGEPTRLARCGFSRDGYAFAGWNTAADGSGEGYLDGQEVVLDGDLALYAQWVEDDPGENPGTDAPLTVTFDANDGSGRTSTQKAPDGKAFALDANAFARQGYAFSGWNTLPGGNGAIYADGAQAVFTQDMVLYAQWRYTGQAGEDPAGPSVVASAKVGDGAGMIAAGAHVLRLAGEAPAEVAVIDAAGAQVATYALTPDSPLAAGVDLKAGDTVEVRRAGQGDPKVSVGTVRAVSSQGGVAPGTATFAATWGSGTVEIVGPDGAARATMKLSADGEAGYTASFTGVELREGDTIVYYCDTDYIGSGAQRAFRFKVSYLGGGQQGGASGTGKTSTATLKADQMVYVAQVGTSRYYYLSAESASSSGAASVQSMTLSAALAAGYAPDPATIANDGYSFEVGAKVRTSTLLTNTLVWVSERASYYHLSVGCTALASSQGSAMKQVQLLDAVRYGIKPCPDEFADDGYGFSVPTLTTTTTTTLGPSGLTSTTTTSLQQGQARTLSLSPGQYTVGTSALVAGTYDVAASAGEGTLAVTSSAGVAKATLQMSAAGSGGIRSYSGLLLSTGDVVRVSDGLTVTLASQVSGSAAGSQTMPQLGGGVLGAVAGGLGAAAAAAGAALVALSRKGRSRRG